MRCFIIKIGGATFALPEDTGICIQDLLLQAIPLVMSFKPEFYWAEDTATPGVAQRSSELQLIEVGSRQIDCAPPPSAKDLDLAKAETKVIATRSDADQLLEELTSILDNAPGGKDFDDDIPF